MLPTNLSQDEQWEQINYSTFDDAMYDKIKDIRTAMQGVNASAVEVNTQLNEVPIAFSEMGNDIRIKLGTKGNGEPFYDYFIPIQWLG